MAYDHPTTDSPPTKSAIVPDISLAPQLLHSVFTLTIPQLILSPP